MKFPFGIGLAAIRAKITGLCSSTPILIPMAENNKRKTLVTLAFYQKTLAICDFKPHLIQIDKKIRRFVYKN